MILQDSMLKTRRLWTAVVAGLIWLASSQAQCGLLLSAGVAWNAFAFEAEGEQATPNYFAPAPGVLGGYSFDQSFDLALFSQYSPGRRAAARFAKEDAGLIYYGGQVGLRMDDSILFAIRGGHGIFRSFQPELEEEVTGRWRGPAGGISFGGFNHRGRDSYLQTTVDIDSMVLERDSLGLRDKKRLNKFGVSLAFVYNDFHRDVMASSLMQSLRRLF